MRPATLVLSAALLLFSTPPVLPAESETAAFTNVNLVPMTAKEVIPGQTVVVSAGRISEIGPAGSVSIPDGATLIDGAGKYLMPGLADMHTHLNDAMFEYPFFNLFLANGVTTIRDLAQGSPLLVLHFRRDIEAGRRLGPNILAAYTIWGWEKDITGTVASQHRLGFDCLKVNSYFSPAGFDTVMRMTKELRWYTLGHIPQLVRLDGVLDGGMNELSHVEELMIFEILDIDWSKVTDGDSFEAQLMDAFHSAGRQYLNASAEEIEAAFIDKVKKAVRKFRGRDITLTTTMIIHEDTMNKLLDIQKLKAAPHARYVAPQFWKDVAAGTDKHQKMVVKGEERAWFLLYELQNMLLRELNRNNVSLVLGTDVGPTYLSLVPGFSVLDELRLLTECGLSPYEAISTATRKAGEVAGRMTGKNDFGTIETGKRADFILLEKNPLDSVGNVRDPLGIMVFGHWLPRDTLRSLVTVKTAKIDDKLADAYSRGGIAALMEQYREISASNQRNQYYYGSGTLIRAGYKLLGDGRTDDALAVFRLTTEEYPENWNAFDSYGEALAKAGMRELAIRNYELACELDPTQENPKDMLRQLRQQSTGSTEEAR